MKKSDREKVQKAIAAASSPAELVEVMRPLPPEDANQFSQELYIKLNEHIDAIIRG